MTVVVADTSPLNYLLLIGEIAVLAELSDKDAPPEVLKWIRVRPAWLQVRERRTMQDDPTMRHLDPGERAAILLALQAK